MSESSTFIWGVDPIHLKSSQLRNMAKSLGALAKQIQSEILPVAVISPDEVRWPKEFNQSWSEVFQGLAQRALDRALSRLKIPHQQKPQALVQLAHSRKLAVQTLAQFAQDHGSVAAIAIGTHLSKTTLGFPGGFAESLIGVSKVPILAFNVGAPSLKKVKRILFATDLSEETEKSFARIIEFAKMTDADLILYHRLQMPIDPSLAWGEPMVGSWIPVQQFLVDHDKDMQVRAQRWCDQAQKAGVSCSWQMGRGVGQMGNDVLGAARKIRAELIAVAAQSGPLAAVFLGSVTRQILKKSKLPVLIVHSS